MSATITITSLDDGDVVGEVTSDEQGYFKLSLKHGTYLLTPETYYFDDRPPIRANSIVVTVEKKTFTNVTIDYH